MWPFLRSALNGISVFNACCSYITKTILELLML